jgi:hypothetical protein
MKNKIKHNKQVKKNFKKLLKLLNLINQNLSNKLKERKKINLNLFPSSNKFV